MNKLKKWFSDIADIFKAAFKKFGDENGSLTAAAISFYVILSLLPLLLLAVAVLGYIVGSSQRAFDEVADFFNRFMPSQTFVTDILKRLVDTRGTIGWIGIGALLWTGSQLFVTLGMAMDEIWKVREKLGVVRNRIRAILLVILFGILVALSIGSTVVIDLIRGSGFGGILSGAIPTILSISAVIVSVAFAILMFSVVYKLTPNIHVRWRSALFGGIFAGILWVIAKELYRIYLSYANFGSLYGSLGSVVILILWIYYSSVILVLGAELAYMNDHNE